MFADEPHVPRALPEWERPALLPHIESAVHETRAASGDLALRGLQRSMTEGTPLTPVPDRPAH